MKLLYCCAAIFLCAFLLFKGLQNENGHAKIRLGGVSVLDGALAESVGVRTLGGVFTPLILRSMNIPAEVESTYTTASDNQEHVLVNLFAGNGEMVDENRSLGQIRISGFEMRSRGRTQVVLTLSIDIDGGVWAQATEDGQLLNIALLEQPLV